MPRTYRVRPGDTLASIAQAHGFGDPLNLYDHGDNADLKRRRSDPNVLMPGDEVVIPDIERKQIEVAAGQRHRFRVTLGRLPLRVRPTDYKGLGFGGRPYRLTVGSDQRDGTVPGNGILEEIIPAQTRSADLMIWREGEDTSEDGSFVTRLMVGHLDPHDEVSGVQGRLQSLGFHVAVTGEMDAATRGALRIFQRKQDLDVTGEVDADTQDRLREIHSKED